MAIKPVKGKIQSQELNDNFSYLDTRVGRIITTPADDVNAEEIIDAREGEDALGDRIRSIASGEGILQGAVSEDKTTFISLSTNLINTSTIKENTSLNSHGEEVSLPNNNLTDYIKVDPNEQYTPNTPSADYIIFYFYSDGTYRNQVLNTGNTITIPEDVGWIRIRIRNQDLEQAQLNKGDTLLPYEKGYKALSEDIDLEVAPEDITSPIPTEKRTILGESVKLMSASLPNIKNRKLVFGTGNLRVLYRNTFSLLELSEPLEVDLTGQFNHIYFNVQSKEFISLASVHNLNQVGEDYVRIGLIQYTSTQSNNLVSVDLPIEYQIDGVEVSRTKLNDRLINIENNMSITAGAPLQMETVPDGFYHSSTTSDYTSPNNYNDNISLEDVYGVYDEIADEHPNYCTKTVLGKDESNQHDINLYEFKSETPRIGRTMRRVKIIIVTGTHGEEKSSIISLRDLMYEVANNWENDKFLEFIRFNVDFVIMPIVNPWGFLNKRRWNVNHVDINRNASRFWVESGSSDPEASTYKGTEPFSEVETRYIRDVIADNEDAVAFFDYHMNGTSGDDWEVSFWHSFSSHNSNLERYDELIKAASDNIFQITREAHKNFNVPDDSGYLGYLSATHGYLSTLGNYAYGEGLPGYTIECTRQLVGEDVVYSNNTLKLCTSFIGNHILNICRVFFG